MKFINISLSLVTSSSLTPIIGIFSLTIYRYFFFK